jgi:hypothetical protein
MWPFKKTESISYYPPVPPMIDLRLRLPRNEISELKVLNVGAGSGMSGLACQIPFLPFKQLDFLDVHLPYLDGARARIYDAKEVNFIHKSIVGFDTSGYDVVFMFDILEHLKKEDSLAVMDNIKCKQVIFIPLEKEFRPNNFGAESQDHLSLWTEQDFKDRGYRTEVLIDFHNEGNGPFPALWAIK